MYKIFTIRVQAIFVLDLLTKMICMYVYSCLSVTYWNITSSHKSSILTFLYPNKNQLYEGKLLIKGIVEDLHEWLGVLDYNLKVLAFEIIFCCFKHAEMGDLNILGYDAVTESKGWDDELLCSTIHTIICIVDMYSEDSSPFMLFVMI